jgi:hypothetical protein
MDFLDMLEPLNMEARYPTYKDKLFQAMDYERCLVMLRKTEELYIWIRDRLSK